MSAAAPDKSSSDSDYSCAICLDTAKDPVVTKCGHLYCWPCLEQWLCRQPECPTCKGAVNPDTPGDIIPLYGKGGNTTTSSTAAASSGTNSSDQSHRQQHSFNTRHERPRAQREQPRVNRGMNMEWGGRNRLGGLFLFGAPIIGDVSMLPIIVLVCIGSYLIYEYWAGRGAENEPQNPNVNGEQQNQQQQQQRPNDTHTPGVSLIPVLIILTLTIIISYLNTENEAN